MSSFVRPFETRLRALSMALAIVLLSALAAAPAAEAQNFTVLYSFNGGDGYWPLYGSLVQDSAGNLYGTAEYGGSSGYGTVVQVTQSGTANVLYNFTGGADGGFPYAGLVLLGNTLYGTTAYGGSSGCGGYGCGVVFAVDMSTGAETVLYTFTGGADGGYPYAGLVQDKAGNLYGTTAYGGAKSYGTVFKVVPKTQKETVLHSFDDTHGGNPYSGLTLDATQKVLFGTTLGGGSGGAGAVFSLTIKTGTYNVLYNFKGKSDGGNPWGTLALDPKGNLYGTTEFGGSSGVGTVFELVPNTKKETVLYSFTGGADGAGPVGGVIRDKNGNLYGSTCGGGTYEAGTVFELVKGTESVLHAFDYSDGADPVSGLTMDSKGDLYGTATTGSPNVDGVVWEITP